MRLNPFDDYPFHQAPTPFATVATTDAHFNDGYFCAFYAAEWYVFTGVRLHPNVNVIDGWAGFAHAGRETAVRASRALHPRYEDLVVGPVRYEILEPMRRVRLHAADETQGFAFDVVLEAQSPPFVEARYQHYNGEDGVTRHYALDLAGTPADVQAGGYYGGWHDGAGPGIYRGAEHLEHDSYDCRPDAPPGPPHVPAARRLGPTEFPMAMRGPHGATGMAHFEHTISGPYPRYGFT